MAIGVLAETWNGKAKNGDGRHHPMAMRMIDQTAVQGQRAAQSGFDNDESMKVGEFQQLWIWRSTDGYG